MTIATAPALGVASPASTAPELGFCLTVDLARCDDPDFAPDWRGGQAWRSHQEGRDWLWLASHPNSAQDLPRLLERCRRDPQGVPQELQGRFLLIWLDARQARLRLISDRFNTCPAIFRQSGAKFTAASRADDPAFGRLPISRQAIYAYLHFHMMPSPWSIFAGQQRLEPGCSLSATASGTQTQRWWQPRFVNPGKADERRLRDSLMDALSDAVKSAASDVPTAAFLSGGLDSSTVCGLLARGGQATAYSIGFEAEGYDEMEYARLVARHFGLRHREYYVTPDDLLSGMASMAKHLDQPFGNSSILPAWCCARLARADGFERLLAGDGGDELFGGNARYARQKLFAHWERLPAALRGPARLLLVNTLTDGLPGAAKLASYVRQADVPMPDRAEQYNLLERIGHHAMFSDSFLAGIDPLAPLALRRQVWQSVEANNALDRELGYDWRFTLADNDLPKVLGATGLAGIDVAFPFLSERLVELSLQMPADWKVQGQTLRWFFKNAVRGFLPDEILVKKKHGFGLPFGVWAMKHEGLRRQSRDALAALGETGMFRAGFLERVMSEHLPAHPGYYGELVWILTMLQLWLDGRDHGELV